MAKTDAILLLGPTGSGKTPLGELIGRDGLWGRRCVHFDFGQALRRVVADGPTDAFSRKEVDFLRDVLCCGALLENEHFGIAEKILRAFITNHRIGPGEFIVLNGLPRHVAQAEYLSAIVEVQAVIELSCSVQIVLERIRTNTGGDRTDRRDDSAEAIRNKLEIFARRTAPLLDYYRTQGVKIERIDVGSDTPGAEILKALNERHNAFSDDLT